MENDVEQRTEAEILESIAYNKRIIRVLEIIFIVFALGVIGFFIKMIAYESTPLDLISYTALLIACWRLWETGQSFELGKFWDELELLKYKKENNEEIS
jgi:hypothetical protein